jgi:diadenosine tetraphosphatase ApaH/serine/threonine PP2A family protein phosphatase
MIDRICFFGHTHYPGIFLDNIDFLTIEEIGGIYMLDNQKILVNVGSVGQPRDEDSRSCYVTFDGDTVVFRRVEYDINDTLRRIYEIPQLDNFLGERLLVGK